MMHQPFYDPNKTWDENLSEGPFGELADGKVFSRSGEPKFELFGNKLFTPFGLPAGPAPNFNFAKAAFEKGFDVIVYKTVRTKAYATHKWPNVIPVKVEGDLTLEKAQSGLVRDHDFHEPLAITNSFGVGSFDPDIWQNDMKKSVAAAGVGQVLIGGFQGTNRGEGVEKFIADHVLGAKLVKETGAKILEMNASCPNEGSTDLLCYDLARVREITSKIKEAIGDTPLFIKLAYFKPEHDLANYVKVLGGIVDGFSTINTIGAKVFKDDSKTEGALPGENRLFSGVCGAPIKWAGLDMVSRLKKLRTELNMNFAIIGCGGVTSANDFHQYRAQGADIVMSATGAMWNPYLAQEIWQSLNQ